MTMTRAQGLPLNTIIIAILGLVVLAIILWITSGRLQLFSKGTSEAARLEECPAGHLMSISECESPLTGNYGRKDSQGNLVKLGYNEACCETLKPLQATPITTVPSKPEVY